MRLIDRDDRPADVARMQVDRGNIIERRLPHDANPQRCEPLAICRQVVALQNHHVPAIALAALERDPNPLHLVNYFADGAPLQGQVLAGRRGTLIIFDTFCIHRGGELAPGASRRNLRGITWARPLTRGYFELPAGHDDRFRDVALTPYRPDFVSGNDTIPAENMYVSRMS